MTCKGHCNPYIVKSWSAGNSRYASGQKRCQVCQVWIEWEGIRCPCCSNKLRCKPRKNRIIYVEQMAR